MKKNDDIMIDARGFMKSRIMLTAAELDLFTKCHGRHVTAKEVADESGLDLRGLTRVLDCLVTFGMIEKEGAHYCLAEAFSAYSSKHPETVLPMVHHLNHLWDAWSNLTETVKTGVNPVRKPITESGEETLKAFIEAMGVVGRGLAQSIADSYDAGLFKCFLDIGGASGTYTIAFLKNNPQMKAVLFDLGDVVPMAEERLRSEGLLERVDLVVGDFYKNELPRGCDLAFLSAIIHQNSPEENVELYRKVYRALEPGGVLLIRDHIMDESRTMPPAGATFAVNMLVATKGGDTYTFEDVKETLEQASFIDVKLVRKGDNMDCLVEARKG